MNALPPQSQTLIGSWRKFGEFGPVYQVTGAATAQTAPHALLHIRVLESGEELDYPVADIALDPLAD